MEIAHFASKLCCHWVYFAIDNAFSQYFFYFSIIVFALVRFWECVYALKRVYETNSRFHFIILINKNSDTEQFDRLLENPKKFKHFPKF